MNSISELTKRDICSAFISGIGIDVLGEQITVNYPYTGVMEELDFITRLYDLETMPSRFDGYKNAKEDIFKHTVLNDDYPKGWIFTDSRFELDRGDDRIFLTFLCEVFDPHVRDESKDWRLFLGEINSLLFEDGYELYPASEISGREIYRWRILISNNGELFIPFSQRNKKHMRLSPSDLSIHRDVRRQIYKLIEKYDENYYETIEGLNTVKKYSNDAFEQLSFFYKPKYFIGKGRLDDSNCIFDVITGGLPYSVFDVIEIFSNILKSNQFDNQLNQVLSLSESKYRLNQGKFNDIYEAQFEVESSALPEKGLKMLVDSASNYYEKGDLLVAVEKIWDAFERLKTYYGPRLSKNNSASKIVEDFGMGNKEFQMMINDEFQALTIIGNKFRIRHHETDKIEITDERQLNYLYKRCLSLIISATQFLN